MAITNWTHQCKECGATIARPFDASIQKCLRCHGEMLPIETHLFQLDKQKEVKKKKSNRVVS